MIKWLRRLVTKSMPRIDLERVRLIVQAIEQKEDFTEPSRSRFRAKYAYELQHMIEENEKKTERWMGRL